ncbi:PREDICTED: centrosomal protein of 295 kDa [Nanorana parkeri]|uniref:centrosomal protein of 295 kDa n=1 Tax=Nanorana parkeri TaxID=125878 RepID=UPI000854F840|nr:PREDICTED: centrosomal protein of 295 kDa [Nanorana parkeri]
MKRKVAKVAPLRLSPNEEALILKEERERRRKLRLQQVREQEKFIAQQIRQDVKERRDQQLQQLAEELRAKWEADQAEKLRALEEAYLSALNAIGEGHRQAKENEPDLKAIERVQALNKEKAEKRHREALQELKQHRQKHLSDQTWHIKARRKALEIEKERAAKVASLPPPPPDPLEKLEVVKRPPGVKLCNVDGFSMSHYHLPEAYVDREMDTEQPDARTAAVEEAKRLGALQKEEERERREQSEKATLRGSCALKMVQLTQDRDRLMKELEQMQQEDLARRRQIVSQMPPQLFEPAYRREEIREEWQRDLESAFEDMYTRGTKRRGDMVLHLKPQPLPDPTVASIDEDLDLSVEPETASAVVPAFGETEQVSPSGEHQGQKVKSREPQSRIVLKRLLNRIRTQKDQWSSKSDAETVSETLESGSLPVEDAAQEAVEQEEIMPDTKVPKDLTDNTVLAGNSILLHPQEQAARIRMETERMKGMADLERQKIEQLELLRRLEEERRGVEEEYCRVQQQMQVTNRKEMEKESSVAAEEEGAKSAAPESTEPSVPVSEAHVSAENLHIQMIREYQQRLLEQNRQHKQSVDEARKRLQEYQMLLKKRYPHLSISRQETPDRSQHSPKPQVLEYPPSSPPVNMIKSPLGIDPLKTSVAIKQNSEQEHKQIIPCDSRALEPEQRSLRNGSTLHDPLWMSPNLRVDFLPHGDMDSNRLVESMKNLDGVSSSQSDFGKERCLQEISPQAQANPDDDETKFLHAAAVCEKQSTTSSPGDYDTSSSTTYNPLPSELSLGLPQIDFSEPVIPLQVPCLHLMGNQPLGDFSNVREFRERLLSSTAEIRAQQEHLKAMQDQLDKQRDALVSKQKSQEENLFQRQEQLEEQMRRHQESLENVLGSSEPGQNKLPADFCQIPNKERYHFMSTLLEALDDSSQEDLRLELGNSSVIKPPGREQRWRPSKPPVTKTKLGPFLEQHELSAIMEVETPTSGRLSSAGLADSSVNLMGQSDVARAAEAICPSDTSPREMDLSGLSSTSMDQSGKESSNQSRAKLSWREMLSLEVSRDPSSTDNPHSPVAVVFPAGDGTDARRYFSAPQGAAALGNATHGRSPDVISDHLSTTTLSTGSFLTSEKTDSSPANSDALSELQRCDYSVIGEPGDGRSSPSAAATAIQSEMRWRDYLTPEENRSHIQQIIAKYTKDLHASLERNLSFRSPEAAIDTSAADNQFPTTFYHLDPKQDFDVSTPSYAHSNPTSSSVCTRDISQGSYDTSSQDTAVQGNLFTSLHNSADSRSSQNMGLSRNVPPCFIEAADSSGSFLPLHPENTLNETNVNSQNEAHYRTLAQGMGNVNTDVQDGSLFSHVRSYAQTSSTGPGSPHYTSATLTGQSVTEEPGSFHELMATKTTINDSELSEHPISCVLDKNNSRSVGFEELPQVHKEPQSEKDSGTAGHFPSDYTPQESSVLTSQETTSGRDRVLDSCDQTQGSDGLSLGSLSGSSLNFLPSTIGSSASSLPSCAYTWDSGSARGILEEPDLTLLSLNDSSVVCSEPTITQSCISTPQEDENGSQHSFKLLPAEVDASDVTLPDRSSLGGSLSQHFAEIDSEFTSTPGSLQEVFMKRKKHFIENSSKRIQAIKTKDRVVNKTQLKTQPKENPVSQVEQLPSFDSAQGEGSQFKKVVEVRVSTPEGRKLSEIEMHQRTIRLYNRLDEVKTRNEKKIRQEAYAVNREKAKEFKKRTLEKLRASKMK